MHVVSISSLSSAIGTSTRFAAAAAVVGDMLTWVVDEIDEKKELMPSGVTLREERDKVVVKADNSGNLPSNRVNGMRDFI